MSPKVRAVQNNTCLENSRKCRRRFVSVKNSETRNFFEFRRQVFALPLHNTVSVNIRVLEIITRNLIDVWHIIFSSDPLNTFLFVGIGIGCKFKVKS